MNQSEVRGCREAQAKADDAELLEVVVRRSGLGGEGVYRKYVLPRSGILRVSDVLERIYQSIDPSLGFRRYLCRGGLCGGCLVAINGQDRLACLTPVSRLVCPILIEPVRGLPVVKDLIVEFRRAQADEVGEVLRG